MCKPEKWASMPNGFDNTWGVLDKFGKPSESIFLSIRLALIM